MDVMHSHGYCISYTQLRQFLTSAAEHVDARQEPTVTRSYIPPEIMPKNQGGQLIVAAADNWDHNERTVDGKRTTHAMTTVFVERKTEHSTPCPRIRKTPDQRQSLDLSSIQSAGDLSKLLPYRKPKTRPEPQFQPQVSQTKLQELKNEESFSKMVMVETVYNIARSGLMHQSGQEGCCVPPWGLFHATLETEGNSAVSVVSFNPTIMANPTEHQTTYTTPVRIKEAMNNLGQTTHVPVVFDMGLLTNALEITIQTVRTSLIVTQMQTRRPHDYNSGKAVRSE